MTARPEQRAAWLVRLYPRQWRTRFPDFEELVAAELSRDPRGVTRDLMGAAVSERLRAVHLIPRTPADRTRSGLAVIYAALIPFTGLAVAMSSQLRTGLAASTGMTVPSRLESSSRTLSTATLAVLLVLALVVGMLVVDARMSRRDGPADGGRRRRPLMGPATVLIGSLASLTLAGWYADRSRWYSPAAAALPSRGAAHAATLWLRGITATITPAWIHPTLFARMPAGEATAALLTPVLLLAASAGLFRMVILVSNRAPRRSDVVLAATAFGIMLVCDVACTRWLWAHPSREGATTVQAHADQLAPGHTGWSVLLLLAMLTALALAGLQRVARGGPVPPIAREQSMTQPAEERGQVGSPDPLLFATS